MLKKFFKKKTEEKANGKNILIAALLIHAAKIDENYTSVEKGIIKKALTNLFKLESKKVDELLIEAEKKEQDSNQIIEFTREIKKNSLEFRLKIIEILWKIVYSDGIDDKFESNLIRRICGLLYISDRDSGMVKLKVKDSFK
tara:strand:+ start:287 stop:712 length:426 start_codon:yes stop_codon:yes gene_type:complete